MGVTKEFATVVASHDFDPATLGLNRAKSRALLVLKGDEFRVFSMPNREWWGARCTANDNIGYIPAAYVEAKSDMDVAAIAAIAREVKINAKAKQTGNDTTTQELGNILQVRQQGGAGPIKAKKKQFKDDDDGVSPELQKLLARRNKIIEEDEQAKEKYAAEPEFLKVSLKKTEATPSDENDEADGNSEGS